MKQKHIDASRELRLWLTQVIIPGTVIVAAVPELREAIVAKYHDVKGSIKTKFKRK